MTDPRAEVLLSALPTAPHADPAASLQAAAESLADMGQIPAGEAGMVLAEIMAVWGCKPAPEAFGKTAKWCSDLAASRAADLDGPGDPLQIHLKEQAAGRYALAPWPWPMLTEASRSLMPGSVTLVCGTPGASKSWFALSCIRHWTAMGLGSSVLMLEETVKWHMQRALAQCAGNPKLLYPEWIKDNYETAKAIWEHHRDELAVVRSHLTCEGDWTLAQCAKWVEEQCQAKKRVVIIDPISLADPGSERAWEADRKFMARAKVAIEASGTSLVLVTHPRKASGGKQAGPPQLDDLAGGAAYGRACASALWVAGHPRGAPVPVIAETGRYDQVVPDKSILVMKARNSVGCGKAIAYAFTDLRFEEQGELVSHTPSPSPTSERASAPKGDRMRAAPKNNEDLFHAH